jgi:endoglycosylceramidase
MLLRRHPPFAFALAVSLAACGTSPTASPRPDASAVPSGPALPVAPIGHAGRWLTDALGRALLPHGVNVVNKAAPYTPSAEGFSDADAAWLAESGFRVVRLGVLATGLMPDPGVVDTAYIQHIDATVEMLASHEIYSLIDFHQDGWGPTVGSDGFPAWMTLTGTAVNNHAAFPLYYLDNPAVQQAFQSFWDDAKGPGPEGPNSLRLEEDYAAMFAALAHELKGEPYVLGYDLFNEPWPGTTYMPCLTADGCASLDTGELAPLYAKAVKAIRGAGDAHLIFGEPFVLFNYGESPTHIPVPGGDANAGMSFHVYPLVDSEAKDVLDYATAWSTATGGALLNTEWGATTVGTTIEAYTAALDAALVPWIFWSYVSEVARSFDAAPSGANLVASTVGALVEPHPLAVAGTPETFAFDHASRTLRFTWSVARAGGGSFASGTVTSFEVPAVVYPEGYAVSVSQGSVASTACAPLLTVAADSDAREVSVTVTPGGGCR